MSDTAMIAFLPTNGSWCKQDFPHMTLVFAGDITGRDDELNDFGKDAIVASRALGTFSLNVTGVETLGDAGEEVDVLTLYPTPQLLTSRRLVEKWDQSGFSDFLPHATIGPAGSAFSQESVVNIDDINYSDRRRSTLPASLYFDRLAVCWGDKRLIFALGNYDY